MPEEIGQNEQLLKKLQGINPNWGLTYRDYLGATQPEFNSGGEDFLTWEGSGGDADTMRPVLNTAYKPPELPDLYTPEQLGYSALDANMLRGKGVQGMPAYMYRERLYSPGVSLGGDDPLQTYIDAMTQPAGGGNSKRNDIFKNMEINTRQGQTADIPTNLFAKDGVDPQWGDAEQSNYVGKYLTRKWDANTGGYREPGKLMNAIAGILSTVAPALAIYSAPAAGAAAAASTTGAEAGASTIPGLTAAEIASEFPAMAGTSLVGPELAATPGYFGSGIGAVGTANASLGGMYGTGVGLEGAALSNAPVTTGKTVEDYLKEKGKSTLRNYAVKKAVGAVLPDQEIPDGSGYGTEAGGESEYAPPHIEDGYYNRFTGERLSPEEFFRMNGRAQNMR